MPSLLAMRRLRHLTLINAKGLSTLPQLHPLLQLCRLSHLALQDCPVCSLVLLRPYMAFRCGAKHWAWSMHWLAIVPDDESRSRCSTANGLGMDVVGRGALCPVQQLFRMQAVFTQPRVVKGLNKTT
jgi:hypothetical protein